MPPSGTCLMADDTPFAQLTNELSGGSSAVFERLTKLLRDQKDYHKLFDALCVRKKFELGAPLHRPTSLEDVPEASRDQFKAAYIAAAREVGQLLLADKKMGQAWIYFHAIQETQ